MEGRGWRGKPFHFKYDQLPWKYLPNIFLFPSKIDLFDCKDCSKDLMENKFGSIWNSWVDSPGLPSVSPCLFVFQLQEGSGLCWLRRYLVCLLLQTSWRGPCCRWSEIGQTWSSCVLLFPQKDKKNVLVSLPSNMFYNLLLWYSVLYGFFFIIIFAKPVSNKCSHFTGHLAFGSATCPRLALSCWSVASCKWLRNAYHSWMNWTGTDRRKESLVFWRITSEEKENLIVEASFPASTP